MDELTKHFDTLSKLYLDGGDQSRSSTFLRVCETLKELDKLPEDTSELLSLHGIGPSTLKEVNEFLDTGTSKRLEKLKEGFEPVKSTQKSIGDLLGSIG